MELIEIIDKKYIKSITKYAEKLEGWQNIKIEENGDQLVSLKDISEKIIVKPQYYVQGIAGAENDCKVRNSIANKLIKIANKLPEGFKLLVWDSFRTVETQKALFDSYYNEFKKNTDLTGDELLEYTKKFVSLPSTNKSKPSPHNTGAAIDLTICDDNENPIDLGTYFDDFRKEAYTRYYEEKLENGESLTKEEEKILLNRRILCNLFEEEGFVNYPYEIWHKSLGDQMACKLLGMDKAIYTGIEAE